MKTNKWTKTYIVINGPLKVILVRVQKCEESALTILEHVSYAGQSIDKIMEPNVHSDKISDRNEWHVTAQWMKVHPPIIYMHTRTHTRIHTQRYTRTHAHIHTNLAEMYLWFSVSLKIDFWSNGIGYLPVEIPKKNLEEQPSFPWLREIRTKKVNELKVKLLNWE